MTVSSATAKSPNLNHCHYFQIYDIYYGYTGYIPVSIHVHSMHVWLCIECMFLSDPCFHIIQLFVLPTVHTGMYLLVLLHVVVWCNIHRYSGACIKVHL